ncbi:MAG: sigma-70 family RNA polymerase sigma factor [Planctomycetota bacterium]
MRPASEEITALSEEHRFTEMAPRIYRFLLRLCGDPDWASDLAQESLTRGWQHRNQVNSIEAFPSWLFRIALRVWSDSCRRNSPPKQSQVSLDDIPTKAPEPSDVCVRNEIGELLWNRMATLPDRQKQVLHLRIIEQLEIPEIAEVIERSPENVRSNLAAARKKLRQSLETDDPLAKSTNS